MASLARVLHSRRALLGGGAGLTFLRTVEDRSEVLAASGCAGGGGRSFATSAPRCQTRIRSCERSAGGQTPLGSAKRRAARRNAAQLDETPRSSTKGAPTSLKARWGRTDGAGHAETSLRSTKRGASCPKGAWSSSKARILRKTARRCSKPSARCTRRRQAAQNIAKARERPPGRRKRPESRARDATGRQRTAPAYESGSSVRNEAPTVDWRVVGALEMRPDGARSSCRSPAGSVGASVPR